MAIQFNCYHCRSLLRVASARPGQMIQCGKCGYTLQLQPPPPEARVKQSDLQIWKTLPPPPPSHAVQATRETDGYWHAVGHETVAAQETTSYPTLPAYSHIKRAKRRKKSGSGGVGQLLIGLLVAFIVVGGIASVAAFFIFNPIGASAMQVGKYQVYAPGRVVKDPNAQSIPNLISVIHGSSRTRSQFEIALLGGTQDISLKDFAVAQEELGSYDFKRVNRAGMEGIGFRKREDHKLPAARVEVFKVDEGLLLLTYANGVDIDDFRGRTSRRTAAENEEIDNPDDFFSSLSIVAK